MNKVFFAVLTGSMLLWSASSLRAHLGGDRPEGDSPPPPTDGDRDGDRPHHSGPGSGEPRPIPCYLAALDTDGDGVLSDAEREAGQATIDAIKAKYDADQDGHLGCEERSAAVAELCPDVEAPDCTVRPPHALPCYLTAFDTNGDGMLDEAERAAAQTQIDEIKAKYDADQDGHLSCEERSAAVAELCPDVEAPTCTERPHHGLPCFLQAFDADGDGELSEEERAAAKAKIEEVKAAADADGDGVVTREELHDALESLCGADDGAAGQAASLLGTGVEMTFVRGDVDRNETLELSDAVGILRHLFLGDAQPACLDAADANDDARVDVSDASAILGFLFLGSSAPPAPYPDADFDTTEDGFTCISG